MQYMDYYQILGVAKDASPDEIKRAYRKLARKHHPDVNKEADAETRFKEINEAYEVLKDPEKKKLYDQYGKQWSQFKDQPPPGWDQQFRTGRGGRTSQTFHYGGGDFSGAEDFSDFFKNLFGGGFARGDRSHGFDFAADAQGRTHEAEITLSLRDAFHGGTRTISFQSYEVDAHGVLQPQTKTLQVKIPRGVTDDSVIRLAGQGEKGSGRGAAGDLLLRIKIAHDPFFKVSGHDLHTTIAIAPWEAALGARIPVQTVDGQVSLTIPAGTQTNKRFRLRGKGLPKRTSGAGDIFVRVEIRVPTPLSEEERALFEKLQNISTFDPRHKSGQKAGYDEEI
ncbi:J domain-containing protein [Desulfofustis limnaeus]|jgi:curved DNA-binding protein|uniref:Molecular chaperone DnaJ n=1 Tax=Desulfofustis limnaeus TaxID=2740163 RepID=A0ABN6M819_9BACT|nr:J domain-containing protein [Desulfofustis limnaeus]MDX9895377.1 J domain-containing protein [Desulfofustis sp.]BDD87748.1 molecular chaperone DnaJ [Desulfofustis limnaeus]